MGQTDLPLDAIFARALEITDAAERAAFVEWECNGDAPLRSEVNAMLRVHLGARLKSTGK